MAVRGAEAGRPVTGWAYADAMSVMREAARSQEILREEMGRGAR